MEPGEIIKAIIADRLGGRRIERVFFVGCGGSLAAFYPAKALIDREAKSLRAWLINSGEFNVQPPAAFGEGSVLIVSSHRGNTPETVEAAKLGKRRGVPVIALTYSADSPIVEHADCVVGYSFGPERDVAQEKVIKELALAEELLNQSEGYRHHEAFQQARGQIDAIVKAAREAVGPRAEAFAKDYAREPVIYTLGSGVGYGAAYAQTVCILMEMQWIHSAAIHAGELFHGPFEITDETVPFLVQLSCASTRALDERALSFLRTYAKRFEVIDALALGLGAIDGNVVDYFNYSFFSNVYNVYNERLAVARNHPLTTRRYMWKVEY